jgi:hypothetical protein
MLGKYFRVVIQAVPEGRYELRSSLQMRLAASLLANNLMPGI